MDGLPAGHGYVLDPSKVSREEREQNQKNLEVVATGFLSIITASAPSVPSFVLPLPNFRPC